MQEKGSESIPPPDDAVLMVTEGSAEVQIAGTPVHRQDPAI